MTLLPALLALLLLADPAGAQPPQQETTGAAAPADTLAKLVTKDFEIYGPTADDVQVANHQVRGAILQFTGYIGPRPTKMAFVLFRTAADTARFDPKPFSRRRMPVVPWVLPATPGAGSAAGQPLPVPGGDEAGPYTLGHHAGHRFLIDYVARTLAELGKADASGADAGAGTSGIAIPVPRHPDCPVLPDWLVEAVAGHCEESSLQRQRMEFMRSHLEQRIPIAELLEMRRPGAGGAEQPKGRKAKGSSAGSKKSAATGSAGAGREAIFCAESLSLARFIARREQDRFIGMITEGVLHGRTVGDVLNTSQSILSKPEALEKQWLEWMQGGESTP